MGSMSHKENSRSRWAGAWAPTATFGLCLAGLGAQAEEICIRANQVGYKPGDVKVAIAFSKSPLPESFSILEDGPENVVFVFFQGKTRPLLGVKWGHFNTNVEMDFFAMIRPRESVLLSWES